MTNDQINLAQDALSDLRTAVRSLDKEEADAFWGDDILARIDETMRVLDLLHIPTHPTS